MQSLLTTLRSTLSKLSVSSIQSYENYAELVKPAWAPPSWLFGPVWTVLYAGIIVSFGVVFRRYFFPALPADAIPAAAVAPFILNIIFNILFTPIQFGLKNLPLATLDIFLVLGTLIWAMVAIYPHMRWVTYAQIPYLVWVMFATVLQTMITVTNY